MATPTAPLTALHDRARQRALTNRCQIEQAKGVLILLYRIDGEYAFDVLRAWAADTNSPVLSVAKELVRAASGGTVETWNRALRAHIETALALHAPAGPDGTPPSRLRSVT